MARLTLMPCLLAVAFKVCQLVLRHGLPYVPQTLASQNSNELGPGQVPDILSTWLQLLAIGEVLQQGWRQLQQFLALSEAFAGATAAAAAGGGGGNNANSNSSSSSGSSSTVAEARRVVGATLTEVERLVGVESKALASQELLQAAEGLMVSEPQSLLVRVVGHCQQLLGVQEIDGLVPALNRVSRIKASLCTIHDKYSSICLYRVVLPLYMYSNSAPTHSEQCAHGIA